MSEHTLHYDVEVTTGTCPRCETPFCTAPPAFYEDNIILECGHCGEPLMRVQDDEIQPLKVRRFRITPK